MIDNIILGVLFVLVMALIIWFLWRPGRADQRDIGGLVQGEMQRRWYEDGYKDRKNF